MGNNQQQQHSPHHHQSTIPSTGERKAGEDRKISKGGDIESSERDSKDKDNTSTNALTSFSSSPAKLGNFVPSKLPTEENGGSNSGKSIDINTQKLKSKSAKSASTTIVHHTGTTAALKRLMERGDDHAIAMRESIIRAAVLAGRTASHGGSFVGVDGELYPDVGRAFSNHGNLRPCARCKNNKQGAYHCRLRRKHVDLDYDGGGDSAAILVPFFDASIEELTAVMVEKGGKLVNGDRNEGRDEGEEDSDEESMTEQIDKG